MTKRKLRPIVLAKLPERNRDLIWIQKREFHRHYWAGLLKSASGHQESRDGQIVSEMDPCCFSEQKGSFFSPMKHSAEDQKISQLSSCSIQLVIPAFIFEDPIVDEYENLPMKSANCTFNHDNGSSETGSRNLFLLRTVHSMTIFAILPTRQFRIESRLLTPIWASNEIRRIKPISNDLFCRGNNTFSIECRWICLA